MAPPGIQQILPRVCSACVFRHDALGARRPERLPSRPVAYFCAEYAIEDGLNLYAGGLGVLAGDLVFEAGAHGVPFVALGLFYRRGFSVYREDVKNPPALEPEQFGFSLLRNEDGEPIIVDVEAGERTVYAQVWEKTYGSATLLLLDTDCDRNSGYDRSITHCLYDERFSIRILQQLILGIGGVKILRRLRLNPAVYHLNEGHTAFVSLALGVEYLHDHPAETSLKAAMEAVRPQIVATKHTILPIAGIHFTEEQFTGVVDLYLKRHRVSLEEFLALGIDQEIASRSPLFSTTNFMLRSAVRASAVSLSHAVFEKRIHPASGLLPITNGVNLNRWRSPLWPKTGIGALSDREIWELHGRHRRALADFVKARTGVVLDPEALTIVWARRFAAYKRPHLLFSDLAHLERLISSRERPVQFIVSGAAAASDGEGKALIKSIIGYVGDRRFRHRIVYLPDYSTETARPLLFGADVWLATPIRGKEACGTSGMKAGLNGVLQCSVSDGWLEEVDWSDKGWILSDQELERRLYETIGNEIVPAFYTLDGGVPLDWVKRMRKTINLVEECYGVHRMLNDYLEKLYFPCAGVV